MVVPIVTGWWREQFATEGGFGGRPWAPLAFATVEQKARRGLRPEILQATGQLKRAASNPKRAATATSLTLTIDDSGPEHGNVLQYHQDGRGVPKRPLVFGDPLPLPAQMQLHAAAEGYVRDLLRRV